MAEEQTPQEPAPPPTLAESPPTPPQVTYQNGQLSINAHNATLSQTLRAVQQQTGAAMEIPASAANERVVMQLGPGAPHDVLNTLLNGTKFDYIILGVTGDPGAVQRVILTPRQNSPANNVNVAQNNQNQEPPPDDDASPDEGIAVNEPEPENTTPEQQPQVPPGGFRRPGFPGGQPGQPPGFNNGNNGGDDQSNGTKTPEQLMQELQQMQQQQQQYQQQLNPANQPQPQ